MRRGVVFSVLIILLLVTVVPGFCANKAKKESVKDQVYNLLYTYKDAYNTRDLKGIKALYLPQSTLRPFPFSASESMDYKAFCNKLPRVASSWLDDAFKLGLFKVTSFEVDGNKVNARARWVYRTQTEKGVFWPTFVMLKTPQGWKILKEDYGRKDK